MSPALAARFFTTEPPEKPWSCTFKVCTQRLTKTAQLRDIKSRDITLPTKVGLVKAIFFPAVMYGCESWTIKNAERRRIDAFELWC